MDRALEVVVEMTDSIWKGFRRDLEELSPEESGWRPLPRANSIGLIVRHLAIEGGWHRACLERGAPMPHEATEELQRTIDGVPLDFAANPGALEEAYAAFRKALGATTAEGVRGRTREAYGAGAPSPHFLAFHQVMHLAMHWGQIRTIRNLYRKTRGEPARFFPENPTYPAGPGGGAGA